MSLADVVEDAVLQEREACARLAEDAWNTASDQVNAREHARRIATTIRARPRP